MLSVFVYALMLTGFSGGLERMNSSMISWALFFNLGGMSPLTYSRKKAQRGSNLRYAASELKPKVCVIWKNAKDAFQRCVLSKECIKIISMTAIVYALITGDKGVVGEQKLTYYLTQFKLAYHVRCWLWCGISLKVLQPYMSISKPWTQAILIYWFQCPSLDPVQPIKLFLPCSFRNKPAWFLISRVNIVVVYDLCNKQQ